MNHRADTLSGDDLDRTDRLPALDETAVLAAQAADTASHAMPDFARGASLLQSEIGRRDDAIAALTRSLEQKSTRVAELEQELVSLREAAAGRDEAEVEAVLAEFEAREREQATAIHALEDQVSELRAAADGLEQQLAGLCADRDAREQSLLELDKRLARVAAERDEALQRMQELEQAQALRAERSPGDGEAEKQQLRDRVAELRNANKMTREEIDTLGRERDELKRDIASRDHALAEQRTELRARDALLMTLQEQLRSVEARRRYAADFRHRPERREPVVMDAAREAELVERVAQLESELAAARAAPTLPPPTAATGDDVALQLGEVASELSRRDDRIAMLESELQSQAAAIGAIRDGLGLLGAGEAPAPRRERVASPCALTRLDKPGDPILLPGKARVTVGRTPENDLQVDESFMSRQHAVIKLGEGGITVEDAGSTNGVFVNDRRVRRHTIHDGDVLQLGKARFRVELR